MDSQNPPPPESDDDAQEQPQRRGRARERHERRQKRKTAEMPAPHAARPQQLKPMLPEGGFRMPTIRLPQTQTPYYIAGAAVVVILVLYALFRITGGSQAPQTPPNALWLGTEWTYGLDEDRALPDLVKRLRGGQIGTVYAWVSWLKDDQTWGGRRDLNDSFDEVAATVKAFAQEFKQLYPESRLYGWVSIPSGEEPHGRALGDANVQQAIADFSQRVVRELGFDGVFLNVEPVWNNDQNFLALLGQIRDALGDEAFISAAIPPDWSPVGADIPVPPLIVPGTVWDFRYKQSVALLVNEMAVMAYNSGLTSENGFSPEDYAQWVGYQVKTYADAISSLDQGAGAGVQVVVGIPTYEAEPPGHDPLVENIPSALAGVRLGLQQAGENAAYVRGVAIYADWETDETEWAQFTVNWIEG